MALICEQLCADKRVGKCPCATKRTHQTFIDFSMRYLSALLYLFGRWELCINYRDVAVFDTFEGITIIDVIVVLNLGLSTCRTPVLLCPENLRSRIDVQTHASSALNETVMPGTEDVVAVITTMQCPTNWRRGRTCLRKLSDHCASTPNSAPYTRLPGYHTTAMLSTSL